jgi:hypothetical protein
VSDKKDEMHYPPHRIGRKTLKVWLINAKTQEEAAQYKHALGKPHKHQRRKVGAGKVNGKRK